MKAGEKPSSRSPSSKPAVSRNVCLWQGGGGGRGGGRGGGLEAAWSTHGMHSETSCISLPVLSFGGTWYSWASPPNDSGNKHLSSLPHLMNADTHTGRAPTPPFSPKGLLSLYRRGGGGGPRGCHTQSWWLVYVSNPPRQCRRPPLLLPPLTDRSSCPSVL